MRFNIAFYTQGLPFDGSTIETQSLGGSETALICMAREFAAMGHQVTVFCECKAPGRYQGVNYVSHQTFGVVAQSASIDVFFCYRAAGIFATDIQFPLHILVCHDILTPEHVPGFLSCFYKVDKCFVLSQYHLRQYYMNCEEFEKSPDIFWVTSNGVDLELFPEVRPREDRNPNKLLWTSRPYRGFDTACTLLESLVKLRPGTELHVATYDCSLSDVDKYWDNYVQEAAKRLPITILGNLTKKQLYEHMADAMLWWYPTNFPEISCIGAIEAQAAGLPIVTTDKYALSETVNRKAGFLVGGEHGGKAYLDQFMRSTLSLLGDADLWKQKQAAGPPWVEKTYQWRDVAKSWEQQILSSLESRAKANVSGMLRTLEAHNDLFTAHNLCAVNGDKKNAERISAQIEHSTGPNFSEKEARVYDKINDIAYGSEPTPRESMGARYDWIVNRIRDYLKEAGTFGEVSLLDVGCGIGEVAVYLAQDIPQLSIVGIDVSQKVIDRANKWRDTLPEELQERLFFCQGVIEDVGIQDSEGWADKMIYLPETPRIVVLGELLEHINGYREFIDMVEALVEPKALILYTVPWGPWRDMDTGRRYDQFPEQTHIHHWSMSDVMDVFKDKPSLVLNQITTGQTKRLERLGHTLFSYLSNPEVSDTGQLDWGKKAILPRPRQTISLCMIVRNAQGYLHACLDSLKDYVDEIIICDNGSTDSTEKIAREYTDHFLTIDPDPDGDGIANFAHWRNLSIEPATGDLILWVDSDEVVDNPQGMFKYLHSPFFNGFVIRQCHLMLDRQAVPDVPIRLFRRISSNGVKPRFFGCIHEHAEFEMDKKIRPALMLPDVNLAHYGYRNEAMRRDKCTNRNLGALLKDRTRNPSRELGMVLEARDLLNFALWEAEKVRVATNDPNAMPQQSIELLKKALEIHRMHFFDPTHQYHQISDPLYQECLRMSGLGVELAWILVASHRGVPPTHGQGEQRRWFERPEDVRGFFEAKAQQLIGLAYKNGAWPGVIDSGGVDPVFKIGPEKPVI